MMRKQNLLILAIIAIGSLSSIAYATSTVISDSGITTPTLTVTTPGGCSGCGASESSFTNYNTVTLNTTVGASADSNFDYVLVSNNGTISFSGGTNNVIIKSDGTQTFLHNTQSGAGGTLSQENAQSLTGEYKVIINGDGTPLLGSIYRSDNFIQNLEINNSQFSGSNSFLCGCSISISPDGHYIAYVGKDSGGLTDRILLFRGS